MLRQPTSGLQSVASAQQPNLKSLRKRIDEIDAGLVDLIAERMRVAKETVAVKEANGLDLVDLAREAEVVRRAAETARTRGLEPEAMRDVFWRLIGLSRWAVSQEAKR